MKSTSDTPRTNDQDIIKAAENLAKTMGMASNDRYCTETIMALLRLEELMVERDALRAELERLKSYGMQPVSTRLRDLNDQLRQSRDENARLLAELKDLRAYIEQRDSEAQDKDTLT